MRVERALVGLLFLISTAMTGCSGGKLAYNLPPASRLMEPGPGVGGPGPGVIPPAGSPYAMYGGAVGRFGDGAGAYMGGGMGGGMDGGYGGMSGDCYGANCGPMPQGPVMQAGYNSCNCGPGCQCGPNCNCSNGECMNGQCQACSCNGESCSCGGNCSSDGTGCDQTTIQQPNNIDDVNGCVAGESGNGCQQAGFCGGGGGLLGHRGCCIRPGTMEASAGDGAMAGFATSQIAFLGAEGVQVAWDVSGNGMFDSSPLVVPGRQDFYQGAIYRLKLTNLPGRPGVQLYPTLEIAPVTPRTDAYLAHSPIPIQFTEEDFDQVTSGNFVTKVIYLPDPEFQELALAGVETLVSTRLDPGVDPITEADRRGSILAILRIGNKDLEGGANNGEFQSDSVVPAGYTSSANGAAMPRAKQAIYNQEMGAAARGNNGVMPVQYCQGGGPSYGYGGDGAMGGMPMGMPMGGMGGMPGGGMAPPAVPPNMLAGAPQWGMPITGTPIGLPGPPHIPLGVPAGLQQHVMHNRTKVNIPPPVSKVKLSVKQRPGLNYPRPVNHVSVDETQREPLRLMPGWLSGMFHHHNACEEGGFGGSNCEPYPQ